MDAFTIRNSPRAIRAHHGRLLAAARGGADADGCSPGLSQVGSVQPFSS